jgi:hypothetical protein
MSDKDLRSDWSGRVSWSEGVFNSLERFVSSKPQENIEKFAETGDLDDLYGDKQLPSPKPSASHQEYMQEFAERQSV